jgi:hypothetical protein
MRAEVAANPSLYPVSSLDSRGRGAIGTDAKGDPHMLNMVGAVCIHPFQISPLKWTYLSYFITY